MMTDARARGLSLMEVLELRHLTEDGLVFDEPLDPAWVDRQLGGGPIPFTCRAGSKAHLEVQPMGPIESRPPILLRGSAAAALESTCVRCLEPVHVELTVQIEEMLFPEGRSDTPGEIGPEAPDEGRYTGEGIDLANVLREALLLELTMNPVCDDKPACDRRTERLIDGVNTGSENGGDPRWAALRALKEKG
jgi:uncharacterized protein